jgi:hypothetical protein
MNLETNYKLEIKPDLYPVMKQHNRTDSIVLFTKPKTGVCIHEGLSDRLGCFSNKWLETDFDIIVKSVTIEKRS